MAVEAGYSFNNNPHHHFTTDGFTPTTMASSIGSKRTRHSTQHQMNIERLISTHGERVRAEVMEKQKMESVRILGVVGEELGRRMREKEEEIEKMGRVNWVLQEKVKSLWIENQIWREMAETSEATAISLRSTLERMLLSAGVGSSRAEEDCVSSSGSFDPTPLKRTKVGGEEAGDEAESQGGEKKKKKERRMCRKCGERESMVLVLPCRHLCVCNFCGSSSLTSCPVCNSSVNASVRINLT